MVDINIYWDWETSYIYIYKADSCYFILSIRIYRQEFYENWVMKFSKTIQVIPWCWYTSFYKSMFCPIYLTAFWWLIEFVQLGPQSELNEGIQPSFDLYTECPYLQRSKNLHPTCAYKIYTEFKMCTCCQSK